MSEAISVAQLACPRCGVALAAEIVGALGFHRCGACGGVWLDPGTFRAVCAGDPGARRRPPEGSIEDDAPRSRAHDRVTYLRCPACQDVMNRVNFARVSGVLLDVCREHGAWLDAGELRAVRRFVRGPGLGRWARRRELDAQRERVRSTPPGGDGFDLVDLLAGIPDRWDVPSTRSPTRWFLRAGLLAAIGGSLLWHAFDGHHGWWRGAAVAAAGGLVLLVAAACALERGLSARRQERGR